MSLRMHGRFWVCGFVLLGLAAWAVRAGDDAGTAGGAKPKSAQGAPGAAAKPIKALLVTGGCCHDYDNQKKILVDGISARANVEWTIVHEGGTTTDHAISVFKDADWAKGYDVIVHNECFTDMKDPAVYDHIVKAHRDGGVPAVIVHCAVHSYRHFKPNEWHELIGVASFSHEGHRPEEVKNVEPKHPIMKTFPAEWRTPNGELYIISSVGENTRPLARAFGPDTQKDHVVIWTNTSGKARVFGTTLGHHNETMSHEIYLDFLARGLLWACEKLDDEGNPAAGYEAKAAAGAGAGESK